jgi:hypothetical protein
VTGDTFLAVTENTALRHAPVGTFLQLDGAPPHFSSRVRAVLYGELPDRWIGRGGPILSPPPPDFTPLDFFSSGGVCKRHCLSSRSAKCE